MLRKHPDKIKPKLEKFQPKLPVISKPDSSFYVRTSKSEFIKKIIEHITINGRPIRSVFDTSFSWFIKPYEKAFEMKISLEFMQSQLEYFANLIKAEVTHDLKSKLFCLKIDCATRLFRSFLGVNVQYYKNGNIFVRNLACLELFDRHTGKNLSQHVIEILDDFKLSIGNVFSITSDNASNMAKTVTELNDQIDAIEEDIYASDFEEETENDIIKTIIQSFSNIEHMRCAEHSLQLGINSVIRLDIFLHILREYDQLLENVRSIIKLMRTQLFAIVLHSNQICKPVLDVVTRWGSTYKMLEYFFKNLDFIKSLDDQKISISLNDEKNLKSLFEGLHQVYILTKNLQKPKLLLSDAYILWNECLDHLREKPDSHIEEKLFQILSKRNSLSKNSQLVKNAIFSDPRLKFTLSEMEKDSCSNYFKKFCDSEIVHLEESETNSDTYLSKFIEKNSKIPKNSILTPLDLEIEQYLKIPIENDSCSPLEFWIKYAKTFPILSEICSLSLIVPATQVSVESMFSDVAFIMSPLRNRLSKQTLKNIILVRKNSDIFNKL